MGSSVETDSGKVPIWLDVDTGSDDVFAILLASSHPSFDFLGVSTTHGNTSLANTARNTSSILTAFGLPHVPVYPGCAKPFCRSEVVTFDMHGSTGLGGVTLLPPPEAPIMDSSKAGGNAIVAMRDALMSQPRHRAYVVATGPLTNVALLFATFPEVAEHVGGVSIMGGAIGGGFTAAKNGRTAGLPDLNKFGNETDWAEFNIFCDPEAAQSIFGHPILAPKTALITLDITHLYLVTPEIRQQLLHGADSITKDAQPSVVRRLLEEILAFFAANYGKYFDMFDGPPLHDPLAVAFLFQFCTGQAASLGSGDGDADSDSSHTRIFEDDGERYVVRVTTDGAHTAEAGEVLEAVQGEVGRTVVRKSPDGKGVRIPRRMDGPAFWRALEVSCRAVEERLAGMAKA